MDVYQHSDTILYERKMSMYSNFDTSFSLLPVMVILFISTIFILFIVVIIKGLTQWDKNNKTPVLTVQAKVVSKRMDVNGDMDDMHGSFSTTSTYYSTFEVESGDRIEFLLPDAEYGMLAEGDIGKVTFQGTRYKGFERSVLNESKPEAIL